MTSDKEQILGRLVAMSRNLGLPERDYVILGDGNTSARIDDGSFWIKASGSQLHQIRPDEFVEVAIDKVLEMLEQKTLSDAEIARYLAGAKVDPANPNRPSIEASFHTLAYTICGAIFVGHTHPTALNAILCSQQAREALSSNIFTEQILYCGPEPAFVPYADPGLPLARAVKTAMLDYIDAYNEPPRVIMLQNHGLIALGKSAAEVENITAMCVKAARILLGTYLLGGPRFLSAADVERIYTRPDERYRREKLS